jgi:uncharacterized repeat protein (TIGR01451 family)
MKILNRWSRRRAGTSRQARRRRNNLFGPRFEPLEGRLMLARDLLVADPITDSILRFHGDTGAPLGSFVSSGSGGLVNPHNPTFGPDGDLFVFSTQPGAQKILRYDGDTGAFVNTFVDTGAGGFAGGFNMAFGPNGDLYVATGGANVLRYNGATGAFAGIAATGNGITRASGVEFGPDGDLYVLDSDLSIDSAYDRILRFNPNTAAFIDVFVEPGSLEDSVAFSFGPDGHIYVPDLKLEQTRSFNGTTGQLQQVLSFADAPLESSVFDLVWGPDGSLFAATGERIIRFDGETGEFTNTFVNSVGGSITFFPPAGPAADLSVTINSAPAGAFISENVSITYTVQNNSASATPANEWVDVLYWSQDETFDPSATEIGRITHTSGLAAGGTYTKTLNVEAQGILPDDYHVFVFADRRAQVSDTNRSNNLAISSNTTELVPRSEDDVDPAHTLAVGRTLSSWTTNGLVGNQLTITYTVYNLTSDYVSDVSLVTSLRPGVLFQSASLPANQNGQQLSWDAGRLTPLGSFSVDVVVTFPGAIPLQLDLGASAAGTVNFVTGVTDGANPAMLRTGAINPALLAATIDADSNDRFLRAKAAELNQDVDQIFSFLAQDVGYESYVGSLRGARGTLWSQAGNSLDQASLLIGLLRASGVPAQYARGVLPDALCQQLIVSMFTDPLRVIGFVPDDAERSDPANDPVLLSEARNHFWVQFDAGAGLQSADPTVPGAQIGVALATVDETFAEVSDPLRHKVMVRVDREMANPGAGLLTGGDPRDVVSVLEQTFSAVELVGRPISIGQMVRSQTLSTFIVATTHNYTPFIRISSESLDAGEDRLITGTDFQETFTNFPFGTTILTGLFLTLDLSAPQLDGTASIHRIEKTLYDRIGFATRQGGGSGSVAADALPALTSLDVWTVAITGSVTPHFVTNTSIEFFGQLAQQANATQSLVFSRNGAATAAINKAFELEVISATRTNAIVSSVLLANSDNVTRDFAQNLMSKSYFAAPRVVSVATKSRIANDGNRLFSTEVDILSDVPRVVAAPGQNRIVENSVRFGQGSIDSALEDRVFQDVLQNDSVVSTSAFGTFNLAVEAGSELIAIDRDTLLQLSSLGISEEAKHRITAAVQVGKEVLVPSRSVVVNGLATIAWLERDPATSFVIYVSENGAHAGEKPAVDASSTVLSAGSESSVIQLGAAHSAEAIEISAHQQVSAQLFARKLTQETLDDFVYRNLVRLSIKAEHAAAKGRIRDALFRDLAKFEDELKHMLGIDPPVPDYLIEPPAHPGLAQLNSTSGIAVAVVDDPLLFFPSGAGQLFTIFRIGIKNGTAAPQTFDLTLLDTPPGFKALTSISRVTIPPGEIAEVGLGFLPTGNLPAPGTISQFTLNVISVSDPDITETLTESFEVPVTHGVVLTANPTEVNSLPGAATNVEIQITSAGNVAQNVSFTLELPTELALDGLTNVTLAAGEAQTLTLTLTFAAAVPINTRLYVTIIADFGTPIPVTLSIPVNVTVPQSRSAADAAAAARLLDNLPLAERLDELSTIITGLVQQPGNKVFKDQAIATLDTILTLVTDDSFLNTLVGPLTTARNQLAGAMTQTECLEAIDRIGDALDDFAAVAEAASRGNFEILLSPNVQVAQPLTPREFVVKLHNVGTETSTYNLAVSGLPPEVSSQFSHTQVTLDRDEFFDVTLTLTQTTTDELLEFDFSVDVSIDGVTPAVTKSAIGSLRTRNEVVSVAGVIVDQPFVDPGEQASVSARILNAVNQQREVAASFIVKNSAGQTVYTSPATQVSLGVVQSLITVNLGLIDTAALALPLGEYTVTVSVSENGQPIPGTTRDGRLLVGSPVTSSLTVTPDVLAPGNSTVTNTLEVALGSTISGGSLELVGQLAIPDNLRLSISQRNNLLYIIGEGATHIVDIASKTAPVKVGQTGGGDSLTVVGDQMYIFVDGPSTVSPAFARGILNAYSLTTGALFPPTSPTNPFSQGNVIFGYQFVGGPLVIGNRLYASQLQFRFVGNDITEQTGDVLSFDITNPFGMQLLDVLIDTYGTAQDAEGIRSGSPFHVFGLAQAATNTLYAASTTATIVNNVTTAGTGLVRIVDITNPANLQETGTLAIPNTTFITSVTVEGNRAYLVGTQGGWKDPFADLNDPGPTGSVVLTTLDISNPNSPTMVGQTTLSRAARGAGGLASIGGGRFVFTSLGELTDTPKLYIADFANPNAVQIVQEVNLTDIPRTYHVDGSFLYLADSAGLKVFSLAGAGTTPVHAEVQIPNGTGVEIVAGSFNVPPTNIIDGANFDTLVWDFNLTGGESSKTITWQSNVMAIQPGETRAVTLDSTIDFTFQAAPGEISLPPETVVAEQVLGLSPAAQTKRPGEAAVYTVTIENPSAVSVTYDLSVAGVPQEWIDFEPQVVVAAGGSVSRQLTLTSGAFDTLGEYGFVVTATTGGVSGSVEGTLELLGDPLLPTDFGVAKGVFAELIPVSATAGQGTAAKYTVRVTNTGSTVDQFVLFATGLPAGFAATFDSGIFEVPPGASNFREFELTIVPPVGTTPGAYPFTVTAASVINVPMTGETTGSLTVLNLGVDVNITQTSGPPGSAFQMVVTNTGQVAETFDLAVAAPSALVATLGTSSVNLAPGASQTVPITVGAIDFAFPGALPLVGIARSRANSAVFDSDSADVTIAGRFDMTAAFEKNQVELPAPGPTSFLLLVENIGNLEDQYTAQIIGTTGPVTANLRDLSGLPTQSIPLFILPGLSTGAILLDSILTSLGTGTITLQVKSLTDNSIVAQAVANVTSSEITTTTTVITSSHPAGSTYGQQVTFTATVSAASGSPTGAVQFQIDSVNVGAPVTLVGGAASFSTSTLTAANHTITALYSSSTTNFVNSQGSISQQVSRAPLTITATDKTKVYGAALPPLTVSYAGFVNGETLANLTTQPNVNTTATANSNVGTYPIVASGAAAANYNISYVNGTLSVTKAPLTITADNKTKVSGDPLPAFTASYAGFVNNDTVSSLDTPAVFSTTATATSPAGDYPINVSGATDANYNITFVRGNLHVTAPPTPTIGVDLLLSSHGSPASIVAGKGTVTYNFTVKNIGKLDATGVKVSLASVLPHGVTVKKISAPSGTSFSGSGGNGTWNVGKLKKNASLTLCVTLTVGSSTAPGVNVIRSTATAAFADQGLINTSNDTTTQTTSVTTSADVAISKHVAPSSAAAGSNITYEVTVTNSGPGAAHNVSLVDTLPVGTTFVSQSQISGPAFVLTNTPTQVTNTITTLAANASAKFSIVARVAATVPNNQKLTNKVTVATESSDPKSSNNTSTATTTVVAPKADVAITKHTAPTSVQAGGVISYTITVCNSGPTAASNVSLMDMLPAGTTLVQQAQTSGPSFVLGSSANQVTNTIASLPSGVSATFAILVKVDGELSRDHQLKNKVTISSATSDPKTSNNSSTVTTKVYDSAASLHASPSDPTKLDLVITGSTKNDTIAVNPASSGKLSVKLNGKSLGTFSPTRNIVVYGRAGNDTVTVSSQINRSAILFGGSGDDKLQAGAGSSVLSGGDGKDNLISGAARNILIAGNATNTLNGTLGENVLVGGSTSYDANQVALEKLLAEWSRTDAAYSVRVQHLRGTLTDRLNDPFALTATTVVDNESVDQLLAGLGSDWFLADTLGNDADQLPPLQPGEIVDAI